MVSENLPPLNFSEDVEKYEAFTESKTVYLPKCPHKDTEIKNGKLICKCGSAWSDTTSNLTLLKSLLDSR